MSHWKHNATRCAVEGCERRRMKGWSTCSILSHDKLGKSLYGAGRIEPIAAPDPGPAETLREFLGYPAESDEPAPSS